MSMARALAPASRSGCIEPMTLVLPPVPCSPTSGLMYAAPAGADSIFMVVQSPSSSSMTIWGRAVMTPWPISDLSTTTVTMPSVPILSQAFGTKGGPVTAATFGEQPGR